MDVFRALAHLLVFACFTYLAFDEWVAGRKGHAITWGAMATERLIMLGLLSADVIMSDGQLWLSYRDGLTPFVMVVASALAVFTIGRIRLKRRIRKQLAPLTEHSVIEVLSI
jgi:hypothetical protein